MINLGFFGGRVVAVLGLGIIGQFALRCLPALQLLYLRCVFATSRVDSSALAPAAGVAPPP